MESLNLNGFLAHLLAEDLKPRTVHRHRYSLMVLVRHLPDFSTESLNKFVIDQKAVGKRNVYINQFIYTAREYCRFANLPIPETKPLKEQSVMKSVMSDEEIEAFINLPIVVNKKVSSRGLVYEQKNNTYHYETMSMFWKILAFSGMRPGEVAHLKVDDIDFGRGLYILTDTKTNDPRLVPIAPNIRKDVEAFVAGLQTKYLFPSKRNTVNFGYQTIDEQVWGKDFRERINRLGIKRSGLTPYSLRHSLITRLLNEDTDLFKVQKLVGHRRIETTAKYRHLTTKDIEEALQKDPMVRRAINPRKVLVAVLEWVERVVSRDDRFEKSITDFGDEIIIKIKVKKDQVDTL